MYKIDEIKMLRLGQRDENLARSLPFDCSDWLEQYPEASIHILFRRPGESAIVPMSTTLEGTTLTWLIHDFEVGKTGIGNAEFRAVDTAGLRRKSRIIPCSIEETLLGDDETVLYTQNQVDETLAHISEAAQAALAAKASEEAAALSAQEAGESAASAGTAADVAVGAKDAAQAAQTAAETAQHQAEAAQSGVHADAEAAEQAKVAAQAAQASAQGAASQASADRVAAESARADAEAAAEHAEAVVEGIDQAGADQVAAVNAAGQAQVTAVNTAGATQVGNVNTAGTTQVNAVQAKGTQVINSIPADYSALTDEVTGLKSAIDDTFGMYDITLENNKSITNGSSGAIVIPSNIQTESGFACCCISCQPGDAFTVNGRGGNSTRLWSFSDANGAVLTISGRTADADKLVVIAPANAAYFAANFNKNYTPYWAKKGSYTDKTLKIEGKPADAKETGDRISGLIDDLGYWYQKLVVPANTSHSATKNDVPVNIKANKAYCIVCKMNMASQPQIYAFYADGLSERIYINTSSTHVSFTVKGTASKDIVGFGVYALGTSSPERIYEILVFLEDGVSWLFNYGRLTKYYVRMNDGLLCFEEGRARADVNTIHQSIAVFNNQVWEFGEGKAAYNGNEYTLENGHANCCNWGDELHGDYPYLYCPKLTNKEINVFSFDGTSFTLVNTITIQIDATGSLNAFIDERNGFIYGFVSSDHLIYFVSDMTGAILETKRLMYKIPTIQNVRLYEGILYVVSGFGNQASPNYLSKITTDGALLGRYQMAGIGEIEGIDFLDNKMILASYYNFYINPVLVPETRFYGYVDQLKATT